MKLGVNPMESNGDHLDIYLRTPCTSTLLYVYFVLSFFALYNCTVKKVKIIFWALKGKTLFMYSTRFFFVCLALQVRSFFMRVWMC